MEHGEYGRHAVSCNAVLFAEFCVIPVSLALHEMSAAGVGKATRRDGS